MPNSGLFISYPKLVNAWRQQQAGGDRRASLSTSTPVLRAPRTPDLASGGSPSRRSMQVLPGSSGIARHRQSLIGSGPRRSNIGTPSLSGSGRDSYQPQTPQQGGSSGSFKRPSSAVLKPEAAFPSVHSQSPAPPPAGMRTISGTSSVGAVSESDHSLGGGESVIINRKQDSSSASSNADGGSGDQRYEYNGSSSAAVAQAVAMAVSQVQADAQREIHELKQQLESVTGELEERGLQLDEQTNLLRELESTVVEFQSLKEAEEASQAENNLSMGDSALALEELKQKHAFELEERDRKTALLKTQLETRRNEFRQTLEDLQTDMHESNAAYTEEIQSLQTKLAETEHLHNRVQELEQLLAESGNQNNSNREVADQEAKAQISKLAELENKLLDKDQQLTDMKQQLEQARRQLAAVSAGSSMDSPLSSPFSKRSSIVTGGGGDDDAVNEKLKQQLKTERAKRIQLETEVQNLESIVESKIFREEELEAHIEALQQQQQGGVGKGPLDGTKTLLEALPIESPTASKFGRRTAVEANNDHGDHDHDALPLDADSSGHAITTKTPSPKLPTTEPQDEEDAPAPEPELPAQEQEEVPIYKSPKKVDPAAGRDKWCGLCEREGHESIECPYEEDF